ncbi:MAG: DUF5789 family protein [Candidatus Aquicultorales bacterium]
MNAYGKEALGRLADEVSFPISKRRLLQEHGQEMIEIVEGHPVRLWMLLANCPERDFMSKQDLITCPAVEEAIRTEEEEAA